MFMDYDAGRQWRYVTFATFKRLPETLPNKHFSYEERTKWFSLNDSLPRIPERLGFKQDGTSRDAEWLYDHFVDHAVYSILKRERDERRGS